MFLLSNNIVLHICISLRKLQFGAIRYDTSAQKTNKRSFHLPILLTTFCSIIFYFNVLWFWVQAHVMGSDVINLVKQIFAFQEQRVLAYKRLHEGHLHYLSTAPEYDFLTYRYPSVINSRNSPVECLHFDMEGWTVPFTNLKFLFVYLSVYK